MQQLWLVWLWIALMTPRPIQSLGLGLDLDLDLGRYIRGAHCVRERCDDRGGPAVRCRAHMTAKELSLPEGRGSRTGHWRLKHERAAD